jgi:hypothetical protein
MSGRGRMWTEYWVDCATCDHHEPLAEKERGRATAAAKKAGWRKIGGKWFCKDHALAERQSIARWKHR